MRTRGALAVPKENLPRIGLVNFGVNSVGDQGDWLARSRKTQWEPEQALMGAIIEDAIDAATMKITGPSGKISVKRKKHDQQEARAWIKERATGDYIFSFSNCCEAINIDPSWLRKQIVALWRKKD